MAGAVPVKRKTEHEKRSNDNILSNLCRIVIKSLQIARTHGIGSFIRQAMEKVKKREFHLQTECHESKENEITLLSLSGPNYLKALFDIYSTRNDLIRSYPEVISGDLRGLLTWAVTSGITMDSVKSFLEPYREQLVKHLEQMLEIEKISKPHKVYAFAAFLGHRFGCTHLIDIGCGRPTDLGYLSSQFQIIGIGSGANIQLCCTQNAGLGTWIETDLEGPGTIPIAENILEKAIVIYSDVNLAGPNSLMDTLKIWLNLTPICVLATSKVTLSNVETKHRSLSNLQIHQWNADHLERALCLKGLNVAFTGITEDKGHEEGKSIIVVIEKNCSMNRGSRTSIRRTPSDFHVVAFMKVYNEEDIIVPSIRHLINQGIHVYVIDSWSNDSTYKLVKRYKGKGIIGIERFPKEGPSEYWNFWEYLRHVEILAGEIEADWFINNDADEIRVSPWPGISLKDGIYRVDRSGFNCIDHTVIEFPPTDNDCIPSSDFESHFRYFEFDKHSGNFVQMKTWKNLHRPITLTTSGGHDTQFEGRRVCPYKFLLKHYPIRSQKHGEKKVFLERKRRYHPLTKAIGWAVHYDHIQKGHKFVRNPNELEFFDENSFNKRYLIERLSGVGILQ